MLSFRRGVYLCLLAGLFLGRASVLLGAAAPVTLTITFERAEYFVGENVRIQLRVENTGTKDFLLKRSGSEGLKITATDAAGHVLRDPTPVAAVYMGIVAPDQRLRLGEHYDVPIELTSHCRFVEAGQYTIRVEPQRDVQRGWWDYPIAEAVVSFKLPTQAEAEKIVDDMMGMPSDPTTPRKRISKDPASLTLPLYLKPLTRWYTGGNRQALAGISSIETPEATAAMLKLLQQDVGGSDDQLFYKLNQRLPRTNPAATAAKEPAPAWWSEQLVGPARVLAEKWFTSGDAQHKSWAAQIDGAVGTAEDALAIWEELERAIKETNGANVFENRAPLYAGVITAMRARRVLPQASDSPRSLGEVYLYFEPYRAKPLPRPKNWRALLDRYATSPYAAIRNVAIASIPHPVPDDCTAMVEVALKDPNQAVRESALFVKERVIDMSPMEHPGMPPMPQMSIKLDAAGKVIETRVKEPETLTERIARRPNDADAYRERATERRKQGDFSGALDDANHAVALAPKSASGYIDRGLARVQSGDYEGGIADYTLALGLEPKNPLIYNNRGIAKHLKGDDAEALKDFDHALDLRLDYADALAARGLSEMTMGDLDAALSDCTRALVFDPNLRLAVGLRAMINEIKGDFAAVAADDAKWVNLSRGTDSSEPYVRFSWSLNLRRQHANAGEAGLAEAVAGLPEGWTKAVGRYLLGAIDEKAFLAKADEGDARAKREQTCEACYYAGMTHLIENDTKTAQAFFRRCLDTGVKGFDEFILAKAELARAGGH